MTSSDDVQKKNSKRKSSKRKNAKSAGFREASRRALEDPRLQAALDRALRVAVEKRNERVAVHPDWEGVRARAEALRTEAVDEMPALLEQLEARLIENGCQVHHAPDASAARAIVLSLARERGVKSVVKAKSMTTEEIALNAALKDADIEVLETDLGEYIIQLTGEPPSHVTAPAIHLSTRDIAEIFHEHLGVPVVEDAERLTAIARERLREAFLAADLGISGANAMVAETGTIMVVENEGNARLATSLPRVHIVVAGIEKVVPRADDLAALLEVLPTSATGQLASAYVSFIDGPRGPDEADGPEEVHVVLLDNGRRAIREDEELSEILRCIRCGACQNICPVFRHTGGHAYGGTYAGPFGSVLEPAMCDHGSDLPFASSLCGACKEVCPVDIDLPRLLVTMRKRDVQQRSGGRAERAAFSLWRWSMGGAWRMRAGAAMLRTSWRIAPRWTARRHDKLGWGSGRPLPAPAHHAFRRRWAKGESGLGPDDGGPRES